MRNISLIAAGVVALSIAAWPALAQSNLVAATVTRIDESAGKITLRHGPIKKLDMDEPMTMVFRAQDPAMLKRVKVGDKVKFDVERINGQITVTRIEKAK